MRKKEYTEKELIEGCIQNDRFFQERLYKKYFANMMYMCMRHTQDKEQSMEIVNDGFLRAFKKIDKYSFKGSLEGWIRKIVYHCLCDYFKKHSRYLQFLVLEERDDSIDEQALSHMYVEDILKMVDDLPPATKRVFQYYAIEGYSHKEIAKRLSISEGTSKWHLAAARQKLKQMINQQNNQTKRHAG